MRRALTEKQKKVFVELVSSPEPEDRLKAAKSLRCPPELLVELTNDTALYMDIARKAWANPNLPYSHLKKGVEKILAGQTHQNWGVFGIYYNKNLSPEMCVQLSARVAFIYEHPNFPIEVMLQHYETVGTDRRKSMAKNKNLTQEMQVLLARDHVKVQCSLAKNKHISQETVDLLCSYSSPPLLRRIIDHPLAKPHRETIIQKLSAENVFQGIHTTAAITKHTRDQELVKEILSETDHPLIQKSIFANESLDENLVEESCYSERKEIRDLAVKHPKCPEEGKVVAALMN
jgi:hypothetical protein